MICTAVEAARDAGVRRLSLASVPDHRFSARFDGGLRQFKSCFAPTWEARYMAAPSWAQMGLAIAEMTRLVHRPARPEAAMAQIDMLQDPIPDDTVENAVAAKRTA
jgi:phosphatidylglycerol lysyltransferase